MPDREGIEVLKNLKEHWPDAEVIPIAGFGAVRTAVGALH